MELVHWVSETEKPRRQHCHDTEGVGRDQRCQKLKEEPPHPPSQDPDFQGGDTARLGWYPVCDVSTCHRSLGPIAH